MMAIVAMLAVFASLFPAAQCLKFKLGTQMETLPDDPFAAFKPFKPFTPLHHNGTKERSDLGLARTPAYTLAPEFAAYTLCVGPSAFDPATLNAQLPDYTFQDSAGTQAVPIGVGTGVSGGIDECATICGQISGCHLFASGEWEAQISSPDPCILYGSTCSQPTYVPTQPVINIYTLVGSSGDPHLRNLAGEKFDVNQPDDYLLLRVPMEPTEPALLAIRGKIGEAEDAPCALYMKEVALSGEWLGTKEVRVRSLKGKSFQGTWPNGWPFAMKTSPMGQESEGQWRSWENFTTEGSFAESLPSTISVTTVFRKQEAASGRVMEAQGFEFHVGTQTAQKKASILVAQGSHEGLDVSLSKMSALLDVGGGEKGLGGLLGTEKHDRKVEARTEKCEADRKSRSMRSAFVGSVFTAMWD